mmetsp:Transcript_12090/g.34975  ORF Transcript_12090/g.34975 Transcript_12090/m.34975 type:complete len:204 (+) Transcript_12090:1173-1784(+)
MGCGTVGIGPWGSTGCMGCAAPGASGAAETVAMCFLEPAASTPACPTRSSSSSSSSSSLRRLRSSSSLRSPSPASPRVIQAGRLLRRPPSARAPALSEGSGSLGAEDTRLSARSSTRRSSTSSVDSPARAMRARAAISRSSDSFCSFSLTESFCWIRDRTSSSSLALRSAMYSASLREAKLLLMVCSWRPRPSAARRLSRGMV